MVNTAYTHALPQSVVKDLTAILPKGWILVTSVPGQATGSESLFMQSQLIPGSQLMGLAVTLSQHLNNSK